MNAGEVRKDGKLEYDARLREGYTMLRSLMTAVTGVRAHQTMLDVTGNNIANANTVGFKKDITIFQDLLYQTQKSATAPGDGRGGINAAQVGLGVQVGAIETIFTQGGASYTGNATDMMIQGSGFFVYSDGSGSYYYSRAGATVRDSDNNLVQSGTGYYVQGYEMQKDPLNPGNYVKASNLSTVSIPLGKKLEPNATSVVKYQCNLNSESTAYLPYGFPDLPYNEKCGWPTNPAGTAKITLPPVTGDDDSGVEYDVSFITTGWKTATADGTPGTGANYLTMKIAVNGTTADNVNLVFDMVGIDSSTGKPKLEYKGWYKGDIVDTPTLVTTDVKLTRPDGSDNRDYTIYYEDGALQFRDAGISGATPAVAGTGRVDFTYNMTSSMNYSSFTLPATKTGLSKDYEVLVEFNEKEMGNSSTTMTLWFYDGTNVTKATADVYFDAAGNFDHVGNITGAPDELKVNDANDKKFDIQCKDKDKDGTLTFVAGPNKNSLTTIGTVTQGGFHQTKQTIYDCNGKEYTLEVNFKKTSENRWRWEAFLLDSEGKPISTGCEDTSGTVTSPSYLIPQPNSGYIEFCGCGPICEPLDTDITVPFSLIGEPNQTIKLNFGGDGDKLYGVTQYASETTTKAVYQDGYGMGVLSDFSIGADGTVTGTYTNGQRIPLYRIALATFANEQGLEKVGETMFRETVNSGQANIDAAGTGMKGKIMSQNVEMSNVDLTEEFTHLIIAQRGFQANTRVITTSDQILEEVVNLKR